MATRQYIGARYIPIFADPVQWDNTRPYEYLTMVQYQGETFMSRQAVPIGINLPDTAQGEESNEYWVHMSNWNAQVETYRQEVLQYNNRISTVENDLPISDFDSTNTVKKAIDGLQDQIGSGFDADNTVSDAVSELESKTLFRTASFATVAAMKASAYLENGMIAHTNGFHASGDGGAGWYAITSSGTANEMDVIACGDLYATLIVPASVNPVMFGAVGDGVEDDGAALNVMMGHAEVNHVDLIEKNYRTTVSIKIDNAMTIENGQIFADFTATEQHAGCFQIEADNVTVRNIRFTGTGELNSNILYSAMVEFNEQDNNVIENCSIVDCQFKYAIVFYNGNHSIAKSNYINGYSYCGIVIMEGGSDIHFIDNQVLNCVQQTIPNSYPISVSMSEVAAVSPVPHDIEVIGNFIDNTFCYWEGIEAHTCNNAVISRNTVKNCMVGIRIAYNTYNHAAGYDSSNIIISENTLIGTSNGSAAAQPNMAIDVNYTDSFQIINNTIISFGQLNTGTEAYDVAGIMAQLSTNGVIKNNLVKDAYKSGIVFNAVDMVDVSNNTVIGHGTGSFAGFALYSMCDNLFIHDNFVSHFNYVYNGRNNSYATLTKYLKIWNTTSDDVNVTNSYANSNQIVKPYYNTNPQNYVGQGRLGDIAFNNNTASGQEVAWVCTTANTDDTKAVWKPIAGTYGA